jgi:hypothetical protein
MAVSLIQKHLKRIERKKTRPPTNKKMFSSEFCFDAEMNVCFAREQKERELTEVSIVIIGHRCCRRCCTSGCCCCTSLHLNHRASLLPSMLHFSLLLLHFAAFESSRIAAAVAVALLAAAVAIPCI